MNTEPTAISGAIQAGIVALIVVLVAFRVWTPTQDQIAAVLGLYGALVVIAHAILRSKVTPTAKP